MPIPEKFYIAHMTRAFKEQIEIAYSVVKTVDSCEGTKLEAFENVALTGVAVSFKPYKWCGSASRVRDIYYSVSEEFRK